MATKLRRVSSQNSGSANSKIVQVSDRQSGDNNIGKMQGTTRIIYDAVQLTTAATVQTLTVFQDCRTRAFPLTNLTENKLQKGEAISVQRISFFIIECTTGTTNALGVFPLAYFSQFPRLYAGTYNLQIGQNQVIKPTPLFSTYAPFNPDAHFIGANQVQTFAAGAPTSDLQNFILPHDNFEMKTNLIIPPDIEFITQIKIPPVTNPSGFDFYLGMQIIGVGSLFSPKGTF